jgi:hypothetical protein
MPQQDVAEVMRTLRIPRSPFSSFTALIFALRASANWICRSFNLFLLPELASTSCLSLFSRLSEAARSYSSAATSAAQWSTQS